MLEVANTPATPLFANEIRLKHFAKHNKAFAGLTDMPS